MRTTGNQLLLYTLAAALILPAAAPAQEIPEPTALMLQAANDYRKQARYPGNSKLVPVGAEDPVRADLRTNELTSRGRDGEITSLAVRSAKLSYQVGETVELFAMPAGSEVVAITGEVISEAGDRIGELRFHNDRADEKTAGGVYSARFLLEESLRPELAEIHMVKVQATFANGETRHILSDYLLSNPWATLTGRYRDRIDDGNVVVSAEVEVTRAGRFHLAGTLHTLRGEPIGTAQAAQELGVGKHWIDLSFYGLMFHDREVLGPCRLGSLVLRTVSAMPNAFNDLVEDAHVISAVPLHKLTSKPVSDPGLLKAAKVLEAEAERMRANR